MPELARSIIFSLAKPPRTSPMDQSQKSSSQNSEFINSLQDLMHNGDPNNYRWIEVIEVESSHEVIEIESSHEVIEIESSHEVIVVESSQDEEQHSRFQDSYYNISYDPNREDTLDLAEKESSIRFSGQLEIRSQSESSFEDESSSFTGSPNDYHDLYSQVNMDHLRDLIEERMGPLQSSEMSQANQEEQEESENIIKDSDEQDVETPRRENRKKTKMIKKTHKK